jgi:Sugar phosphate permease
MGADARPWLIPIATIFLLQTSSSFLCRIIPIIWPALAMEFAWDDSQIGYLTAANNFGALFILLTGISLMRRLGSIRALQASLLVGSTAVCLFFMPVLSIVLLGCLLVGISQGVASPAGSEVLQRFSPPQSRNLVFSVKQAGVPLGGVLAGLVIPPLVLLAGWRGALACAGLLVAAGVWLTWKWRDQIDVAQPQSSRKHAVREHRGLRAVILPLKSLSERPGLLKMCLAGLFLAGNQACWFAFMVTYLIVALDYSLSLAGAVFAVMQVCGAFGRIALGWMADHTGNARPILFASAVVSTIATLLLGLSTPAWPLWTVVALAAAAGFGVSGWNGVHFAELARRSAPGRITETAAGSSILLNTANMTAPGIFAIIAGISGRLDYSLFVIAGFSLAAAVLLAGIDRPGRGTASIG